MQIVEKMRADILNGKYRADQQIPPVRQLAFDASVNPNTMQRALTELEDEGLLYSRGTVGRFVTSDTAVLEKAKETMKREAINALLEEAYALGISREELIRYIQEVNDNG